MGTILRQKSRTEHIGKIINIQRNKFNISDQTRRRDSYTEPSPYSPFRFNRLSEESSRRLMELEKNKRVRTR